MCTPPGPPPSGGGGFPRVPLGQRATGAARPSVTTVDDRLSVTSAGVVCVHLVETLHLTVEVGALCRGTSNDVGEENGVEIILGIARRCQQLERLIRRVDVADALGAEEE